MNQLFIDKLHESMNDKNRSLLEAVELLYCTCEQKVLCEGRLGRALGTLGLCGASYLAGGGLDKIHNAYNNLKDDAKKQSQEYRTASLVANRSYEGQLLKNHGYKFVDITEHPGLYSDTFNGMNLSDLDQKPYVQVGWYVSPDGSTYYSTVTGEVYRMPDGKTFTDATSTNRGNYLGNGPIATGDVSPDELEKCSVGLYAQYGGDPDCDNGKYNLLPPAALDARGAER